jgi:hypothetical protein
MRVIREEKKNCKAIFGDEPARNDGRGGECYAGLNQTTRYTDDYTMCPNAAKERRDQGGGEPDAMMVV